MAPPPAYLGEDGKKEAAVTGGIVAPSIAPVVIVPPLPSPPCSRGDVYTPGDGAGV